MINLRKNFEATVENIENEPAQLLVMAIQTPTGAIETITNHSTNIPDKVQYYLNAYDSDFCLKNNPAIRIVGFMLV